MILKNKLLNRAKNVNARKNRKKYVVSFVCILLQLTLYSWEENFSENIQ